ncbi:polysaccharide pyruvyl transferase family protein [Niallia sp. FSL M8-0099]|uniref:polysaccharide pyruvyl transferase family protein n=1 Tax=Niallia sp. FSL M8-0099 TaxID=2954519 RepID=UPI0030F7AE1C
MKKIGILTINDYNNYGNRLQNYATQEVLKSLDLEVETIINSTHFNKEVEKGTNLRGSLRSFKRNTPLGLVKKIGSKLIKVNYYNKRKLKRYNQRRIEIFKKFSSDYIIETNFTINEHEEIPKKMLEEYDYFITGSDQVWNPNYRKGSAIDFLTFAPKHKRIAYAPSFGVSELPEEYSELYKNFLASMYKLSVREEAGAEIIKKLTNRDAEVLIDPTLMLSKEKWISISKNSLSGVENGYILTYFLGNISKERKSYIKKIAMKNNLKIINLLDIKNIAAYIAGPDEFIGYINSASLICTDSFHGAVFSILLERPFIVFERNSSSLNSMNSRIDTLLSKFKMEKRLYENVKKNNNIFDIDFSHTYSLLEKERKKALDYLKNAFDL